MAADNVATVRSPPRAQREADLAGTYRLRTAQSEFSKIERARENENAGSPMQEILKRALADRYGVAAFNIVNDVTIEAALAGAAELRSPRTAQVSVKTVEAWGAKLIQLMFAEMAKKVPAASGLDGTHRHPHPKRRNKCRKVSLKDL